MFQGKIVLLDNSRQDLEPDNIIQVDESSSVSQDLTMEGSVLSNLKIRVYTGEKSISDTLTVELIDKETGDVVYQGEKETDGFTTNSALYSFIGEKVSVEKGKTYERQNKSRETIPAYFIFSSFSSSIYCIISSTLHFKILQNISIVCVLTLSFRFNRVI